MTPAETSMMKTVISQMIREHKMMNKFSERPVTESSIRHLLEEVSNQAGKTLLQQWRFLIISGENKEAFSKELIHTAYTNRAKEKYHQLLKQYYMKIPMHILVIKKKQEPSAAEEKNFQQMTSFIQTLQLAAWKDKLGIVWKTNEYHWNEEAEKAFGLKLGEEIKGTLHIGYINEEESFIHQGMQFA